MPQAIKKRFDGNLPQFLEDVKQLGRFEAMEKWKIAPKSHSSTIRMIVNETKDQYYGLNSTYGNMGIEALFEEFVNAFRVYVIKTEHEKVVLKMKIAEFESAQKGHERDLSSQICEVIQRMK